jgi:hypothetical protein
MSEDRPPPNPKLALVAPLSIGAVVVAIILIAMLGSRAGQGDRPSASAAPPASSATPVAAPPIVTPPPPPLDRSEMIQAADAYADAYVGGTAPALPGPSVVGRQFTLRIPFGCDGTLIGNGGAPASVEYDPQKKSLRFEARPSNLSTLPLIQNLPDADKIERVEGFWIPRPWVRTEACPIRRDDPPPATPTPPSAQTLGLARIFDKSASRLSQRSGHAYEFSRKLDNNDVALLTHTYRLVIEGRVVGFSDGQPVHCWVESPDHRPICLYAVEFDRVAFEDAMDHKLLAEWRDSTL